MQIYKIIQNGIPCFWSYLIFWLLIKYCYFCRNEQKITFKQKISGITFCKCISVCCSIFGFFHTHTNNFKEDLLSFSKKPVSEKIVNFGGVDDCFSSHFFNAGIGILDADANFLFIISKKFTLKNFQYHFTVPTEKVVFFSLRAPPVFI